MDSELVGRGRSEREINDFEQISVVTPGLRGDARVAVIARSGVVAVRQPGLVLGVRDGQQVVVQNGIGKPAGIGVGGGLAVREIIAVWCASHDGRRGAGQVVGRAIIIRDLAVGEIRNGCDETVGIIADNNVAVEGVKDVGESAVGVVGKGQGIAVAILNGGNLAGSAGGVKGKEVPSAGVRENQRISAVGIGREHAEESSAGVGPVGLKCVGIRTGIAIMEDDGSVAGRLDIDIVAEIPIYAHGGIGGAEARAVFARPDKVQPAAFDAHIHRRMAEFPGEQIKGKGRRHGTAGAGVIGRLGRRAFGRLDQRQGGQRRDDLNAIGKDRDLLMENVENLHIVHARWQTGQRALQESRAEDDQVGDGLPVDLRRVTEVERLADNINGRVAIGEENRRFHGRDLRAGQKETIKTRRIGHIEHIQRRVSRNRRDGWQHVAP